ncbi:MAG: gephyrin-like molybdotransferase Glp [Acidimicrobiia bacterium]
MKPLEEVRAMVLAAVQPLESEKATLDEALGRILFSDVIAPGDVPPFQNSAMDGYAVRASDVTKPGARLEVVGEVAAGVAGEVEVEPGQAVKIMTGAPMPAGADTVVRVEDTSSDGSVVSIGPAVAHGTSVRPAGGDVRKGQQVFSAGTRLTPMHIGVLATIGVGEPEVTRRPRVAFMSTGDELTPVSEPTLRPGAIRDSNRPMLRALLSEAGAELVDLGIVPDDPDVLREKLDRAAADADVIVSTGGVSMGDYDVTKLVLKESAHVDFLQVAIQPAKPFAFGTIGDKLFFGLPGNPVSVLVSFENFLRPALLSMQRATRVLRPRRAAIAGERIVTDGEKTVFVRVKVMDSTDELPVVVTSGGQSSNVLSAAANADAFAVVPRGVGVVEEGDRLVIEMFKWPETREYQDGI